MDDDIVAKGRNEKETFREIVIIIIRIMTWALCMKYDKLSETLNINISVKNVVLSLSLPFGL